MSMFGEAKAAILAVGVASCFGSFPLNLEGDSLVVITVIKNPSLIADWQIVIVVKDISAVRDGVKNFNRINGSKYEWEMYQFR